ncbi:pseudouridine synthase [Kordiimonas pumila]|uniref:Dual-specificity RNA pseudouridine synthase RluA n=1 Tax=Kordiimonas pumila TaxID=2161677 RepID=A0ABV7D0C5_9PROT|nr:pseudouridine synthase [Kordiimonas pumila]
MSDKFVEPPHYDPPMDPYLEVLYVDEDILVLNKPSGLLSVEGRPEHHKDCLIRRAREQYPSATVVHRLDRDTSGVIVMALNMESHRHISKQFEKRETSKTYIARLSGLISGDKGTVNLPLKIDWPNRPRQKVDFELGREAITHWEVAEREESANATRVVFYPITGRSHQLRVHALELGHPIMGDSIYGDEKAADRLHLHAAELSLFHPVSGERLTFKAPAPF